MALPNQKEAVGKVQFQKKAYQRTYSIKEISSILNINEKTIRQMARANFFPNLQLGKQRIVVPCAAFDKWFDNLTLEQMASINIKFATLANGEEH